MTVRVLAVGNSNTDQVDHRSLITALTATQGNVAHRPGLFPSSSVAALRNDSAMVAGVGPFKAILPNQSGAGQFLVQSDAEELLTFAAGEASVIRYDRIIVRVYNDAQDASGQSEAFVEYLKGQASGAATNVPNGALLLWEFPVPAGASAGTGGINFTSIGIDQRVYTSASGGIIPVGSTSELSTWTSPYEGLTVYAKDIDAIYVHDGTSFKLRGQASVASFANLSSVVNPVDGSLATVRDTNYLYQWDGSSWVNVAVPGVADAWTAYTPTWSASTSAPSLGNGTLTGAYKKIGKTVYFRIKLAPGTTTTYGSGDYSLTLPASLPVVDEQCAPAIFRDNSSAAEFPCIAWLQNANQILHIVYGAGQKVGPSVPVAWGSADRLEITGVYETS